MFFYNFNSFFVNLKLPLVILVTYLRNFNSPDIYFFIWRIIINKYLINQNNYTIDFGEELKSNNCRNIGM